MRKTWGFGTDRKQFTLWLRIRLMSYAHELNGADPSGQAVGGRRPWDSIRYRRMMKDASALQNQEKESIYYISICIFIYIIYLHYHSYIFVGSNMIRYLGWWILSWEVSNTISILCSFAGKASTVILDPLLCIKWDVGLSNAIQLVTFWWFHTLITTRKHKP